MGHANFIDTQNLQIARENMGLDTITTSKKITKSQDDVVKKFESGEKLPTWSQVERLAEVYNISPILLFSGTKITRNKEIPDYRVGASAKSIIAVHKLVNLVITRQKWLESRLKTEGTKENFLQGSGRDMATPKELANFIKKKLGVDHSFIKETSGTGARARVLKYLIQSAEYKGIFVGKTISYHRIEVEDLRGLYISNKYCPYIVINRRDAKAAQIFSFVHELAHLFRKTDSISNSLDFRTVGNKSDDEEIFCNKVAAEFLLPEEDLVQNYYSVSDINSLSHTYKVSELTVFYRLKELRKLRVDDVDGLEMKLIRESKEAVRKMEEDNRKKDTPVGNYVNSMKDSNGSLFNNYVLRLYADNDIGHVEAKNILRFSPELV